MPFNFSDTHTTTYRIYLNDRLMGMFPGRPDSKEAVTYVTTEAQTDLPEAIFKGWRMEEENDVTHEITHIPSQYQPA